MSSPSPRNMPSKKPDHPVDGKLVKDVAEELMSTGKYSEQASYAYAREAVRAIRENPHLLDIRVINTST